MCSFVLSGIGGCILMWCRVLQLVLRAVGRPDHEKRRGEDGSGCRGLRYLAEQEGNHCFTPASLYKAVVRSHCTHNIMNVLSHQGELQLLRLVKETTDRNVSQAYAL
uniref:Uncharacterized protein n=1 Tax=Rhipicephalus zambeziensis TaxID=60191 RepID=A0A224YF86_9ACAR